VWSSNPARSRIRCAETGGFRPAALHLPVTRSAQERTRGLMDISRSDTYAVSTYTRSRAEWTLALNRLAGTMRRMTWNDWLVYLILPALTTLVLVSMYFAGPRWMQEIVAPAANREFGLVENLQNVLLIGCVVLTFLLFAREKTAGSKLAAFFACLCSL